METLEDIGKESELIKDHHDNLQMENDIDQQTSFFNAVYDDLMFNIFPKHDNTKTYELNCNTVYNVHGKWKRQRLAMSIVLNQLKLHDKLVGKILLCIYLIVRKTSKDDGSIFFVLVKP